MAEYNVIDPSYEDDDLIEGTGQADSIYSSGVNSTINANGGDDFVEVYGNFSVVNAGSGKDIVSLNGGRHDSGIWLDGDEANEVYGGNGNDSIYVQSRGASIYGEGGNDTVNIRNGHIYADGGEGNDVFYFHYYDSYRNKDNVTITGGAGNDKIIFDRNQNLKAVITDFSNDDIFHFMNTDYTKAYSYHLDGTTSYGRTLTQHVENGNVVISDNVSIGSGWIGNTFRKDVEPELSITLQGVSDISQVANAKYYVYGDSTPRKQSTLGELFGVESTTTTSTSTEDTTTSTTTSTTSTSTEDTTTSTTTSTTSSSTEDTTTSTTTSTTSTSTEDTTTSTTTSTTSTSTEDTTTSTTTSTTTGDTYNINDNNGTFVNQSSVSGGVTNTSNVDNSQNSVVSDNTWNYNGSTSTTPSTSAVTTTTSTTPSASAVTTTTSTTPSASAVTTTTSTTPSTSAVTTTTSTTPATPTVINNYYGDTYNIDGNSGAVVIGSSVEGGVTNTTNIDNSKNIVISGNTWTYSGGDKVIDNYQQGQVVQLNSDYQGIDLKENSFYVNSSSGSLEIQNARDKFIGYGAGSEEVIVYSYVAGASGAVDGRGRSQAEIMIGAANSNNQIYAGSGGSSMWGGMGGTDIMTGGDGYDEFFYAIGGGSDVIQNSADNDVVNLLGVSLSQITYASVTQSEITVGFNDGGNLRVQGQSATGFRLEGMTFAADRSTGGWRVK